MAGRHVRVEFLTYDGRHPVGIVTCPAFADPTVFSCGTPCVPAKFGEAGWLTAAGQAC